ncbi:MAG: hypothetical protein RJQ08_13345 [Salinisphaeraceae bacterium]
MRHTGREHAAAPSARPDAAQPGGFVVVGPASGSHATACPSFDTAAVMAALADLDWLQARPSPAHRSAYARRLRHARRWFGGRVAAWLRAGMPSSHALPDAPGLADIEPRILARNGPAIETYLADGPDGVPNPLYDRLTARFALASEGVRLAPATVRSALEPLHRSLAWRLLVREFGCHRVERAMRPVAGLEIRAAADGLARYAGLYRGFDRRWLIMGRDGRTRAKWSRLCRRAVLLPGVGVSDSLQAARNLLRRAAIPHGLDTGEQSRQLRLVLLHLAQWVLVTERGNYPLSQAG